MQFISAGWAKKKVSNHKMKDEKEPNNRGYTCGRELKKREIEAN